MLVTNQIYFIIICALFIVSVFLIVVIFNQRKYITKTKELLVKLELKGIISLQRKKEELEKEIENLDSHKKFELDKLNSNITEIKQKFDRTIELKKEELNSLVDAKKGQLDMYIQQEKLDLDTYISDKLASSVQTKKWLEDSIVDLNIEFGTLCTEIGELELELTIKEDQLVVLDDELLYQSFGVYEPKYGLESSKKYKDKLVEIRNFQKLLIKEKKATFHSDSWLLDGSKTQGKNMNNNNIKLTVSSFNAECDTAISKVKFNNIESIEKQIRKAYEKLNEVNKYNKIQINPDYLKLKLSELYLVYEYEKKLKEEKDEQVRIKKQMQDEERALKEIQKEKEKVEKEETHFRNALTELEIKMVKASEAEKLSLEERIKQLEDQLLEVRKTKENVMERERNTRAGYVYIVSNIGSFGENVYKIGMTRRLEPIERVRELSGASVPFMFDVHAMIFSEDAPALESALHKAFSDRRVNKVNERKEFFRITLDEIEDVVVRNHNKTVTFTKLAEAQDYRESLALSNLNKI